MRFRGRRVLVTGGSGGLGKLICANLIKRGATVTILDRQAPAVVGAGYIAGDLSTPEGIESAATEVAAQPFDILINLAGVQYFGPIEGQQASQLYTGYMINLVAPARLIQAVLPGMKGRGFGRIVNVGSIFGSINFAHFATYSSAKAGLKGLSQALRRELVGTGVGVTYVAPRAVRTPLNSDAVLRYAELTGMAMDEPAKVAGRIVAAIRAERRDVYLGFPESLFVRINALFPGLVDGALKAKDIKARTLFPTTKGPAL